MSEVDVVSEVEDRSDLDSDFIKDLESLINKYSQEAGSDTPDFILASYLYNCLKAFNSALVERTRWYSQQEK